MSELGVTQMVGGLQPRKIQSLVFSCQNAELLFSGPERCTRWHRRIQLIYARVNVCIHGFLSFT